MAAKDPHARSDEVDAHAARYGVVLGASNVWLALPEIVAHLDELGPEAWDLHVAHGPGRSWGIHAGVPGLRWTGLSECGLFDALRRRMAERPGPGWALLTDVGNDIPYRCGVDSILAWVARSGEQLADSGLRVGVSGLPIESIERLSPARFELIRKVLFPFRAFPRELLLAEARETEEGLRELCDRRGFRFLPARLEWYGHDPIHVRRRVRRAVFGEWIDELVHTSARSPERRSPARAHPGGGTRRRRGARSGPWRIRLLRAERWRRFGSERTAPQRGYEVAERVRLYAY